MSRDPNKVKEKINVKPKGRAYWSEETANTAIAAGACCCVCKTGKSVQLELSGVWGETGNGGRGQVEEGPVIEDSGFYSTYDGKLRSNKLRFTPICLFTSFAFCCTELG